MDLTIDSKLGDTATGPLLVVKKRVFMGGRRGGNWKDENPHVESFTDVLADRNEECPLERPRGFLASGRERKEDHPSRKLHKQCREREKGVEHLERYVAEGKRAGHLGDTEDWPGQMPFLARAL